MLTRLRAQYIGVGILIAMLGIASVFITRMITKIPSAFEFEEHKVIGSKEAKVFLLIFSDFSCPYCSGERYFLRKILEKYPDKVRIHYKHFPLKMHANAFQASEASECAADQQKFWAYHDELFDHQMDWSYVEDPSHSFMHYAKEIGLDMARFNTCLESRQKSSVVQENIREGKAYLISGTPTALLNGKSIIKIFRPLEAMEDLHRAVEAAYGAE